MGLQSICHTHCVQDYCVTSCQVLKTRAAETTDISCRRLRGEPLRRACPLTSIESRTQSRVISGPAGSALKAQVRLRVTFEVIFKQSVAEHVHHLSLLYVPAVGAMHARSWMGQVTVNHAVAKRQLTADQRNDPRGQVRLTPVRKFRKQ
jgi:hypothetical protein